MDQQMECSSLHGQKDGWLHPAQADGLLQPAWMGNFPSGWDTSMEAKPPAQLQMQEQLQVISFHFGSPIGFFCAKRALRLLQRPLFFTRG